MSFTILLFEFEESTFSRVNSKWNTKNPFLLLAEREGRTKVRTRVSAVTFSEP
jgi:hypothetical protein